MDNNLVLLSAKCAQLDAIVSIKSIKCGVCRKKINIYYIRYFLKEKLHGWRANPDFWQINETKILKVCGDCAVKPYTLKHLGIEILPY